MTVQAVKTPILWKNPRTRRSTETEVKSLHNDKKLGEYIADRRLSLELPQNYPAGKPEQQNKPNKETKQTRIQFKLKQRDNTTQT